MKKLVVVALASMSAMGIVQAQSDVTLYGVLDGGITVSKLKGDDTKVQMSNGNLYGNRWGLKGTEELGGGNYVGFVLEQGFKMSSGAEHKTGKAFSRQTTLKVGGQWGEIGLGRFGGLGSDLGSYSMLGGTPLMTGYSILGDMYGSFYLTDRYDNSIVYVSPNFGGWKLQMMYSNGVTGDDSKWSRNGHYYGVGVAYDSGALKTNLIYEVLDNKNKKQIDGSNYNATQLLNLGMSYDFGTIKIYGAYELAIHSPLPGVDWKKYEAGTDVISPILQSTGKGANFNAFSLGASAPLWGGTLMGQTQYAFGKVKDKMNPDISGEDKFNTFSIGAAYVYPISKRTGLYSYGGWSTAGKAAKLVNDLRGWTGIFGMYHRF